jgi:hypothetical protein
MSLLCSAIVNGQTVENTETFQTGKNVTTSVDNPGWRRKVRLGQQAGSPYHVNFRRLLVTDGLVLGTRYEAESYCKKWAGYEYSGDLHYSRLKAQAPSDPTSTATVDLQNRAKNGFILRAIREGNAFQGGTFIGEIGQTIRGLKHPALALRTGLNAYRQAAKRATRSASGSRRSLTADAYRLLSRKKKRAVTKALTGTWFEFNFGWRQNVRDIENAKSALEELAFRTLFQRKVFSYTASMTDNSLVDYDVFDLSYAKVKSIRRQWSSESCRYMGAVGLDDIRFPSLAGYWGVTASDFLPTVWEVMPYSWVVDYFVNIGEIIEMMSHPTVTWRWYVRSMLKSNIRDNTVTLARGTTTLNTPPKEGNTRIEKFSPAGRSWVCSKYVRTVGEGSLSPSIRFKVPGIGSTQSFNLAALAAQRRLFS